jgi:hypothetical protein
MNPIQAKNFAPNLLLAERQGLFQQPARAFRSTSALDNRIKLNFEPRARGYLAKIISAKNGAHKNFVQ